MNTLLQLNKELVTLQEDRKEIERKYDLVVKENEEKQKRVKGLIVYAKSSVDMNMIQEGIKCLNLRFPTSKNKFEMIYSSIVNDAKKDLATGCEKLKNVYFGQKYYSGFDQREDHRYGYGPKHGHIYQSIGLRNPEKALSDEQIEACLYTLENLETVLEVRNEN